MSGLSFNPADDLPYEMLADVYEYNPNKIKWTKKKLIPNNDTQGVDGGYLAAAPIIKKGDSHILIFGGAGGKGQHLFKRLIIDRKIKELKNEGDVNDSINTEINNLMLMSEELLKTTYFSKTIWAYHTITDTWTRKGELKEKTQVVSNAVANIKSLYPINADKDIIPELQYTEEGERIGGAVGDYTHFL